MQGLIILCRQVLSSENDNVQRSQVTAMTECFPDHTFDPVTLDSVFQVAL